MYLLLKYTRILNWLLYKFIKVSQSTVTGINPSKHMYVAYSFLFSRISNNAKSSTGDNMIL